ncbi:ABC transporter ATP-binding protein [Arcanobacterium hippocoleae]|uniref:ABC-2 type transport system ATP-binding protein n=1 Tax=Arcanobacterium hippocoleae TaxID=149017 RepID=A0ABU1T394_9ACTO|nr:ATP-binding cassette domain-containing protein [Arcanobacterium hippocoleae]MDR6939848.1 ABC-2 type transport system ATP-binding protein [Arcanobacterium hippocoleae]
MTLQVASLYKTFGQTQALDGMSFTAHTGQMFGFVGSNGAGKTTTMRIMLGVLKADSGKAYCDGKEIDFATRKRFGYMPEERGLYPRMKVQEQLEYLGKLQGLSSADARKAALYWTERLGVASRRNDQVQALSLGNQQRVQLSAALIHNPDYLVLDEPFSGLDPVAVDTMSRVLREKVAQGATVLFSSHQLDLVERICDRVGICSLGKIVSEGTIEELRRTEDLIYDITVDPQDVPAIETVLQRLGTQIAVRPEKANILRVTLPAGMSEQQVLRAVLDIAPVRNFDHYRPHLTELFSNVVTVPNTEDARELAKTQKRKRGFAGLFGGK